MSDTVALVKYAIARQRTSLIILLAIVLTGLVSALVLSSTGIQNSEDFAIAAMAFSMFPAAIWALVLFVFSDSAEMMDGESGFNRWLLRMPIAGWKLALVPVALKTIWICALWMTFALTMRYVTGEGISLLNPAVAFSATGIWLLVVTWRPFANGWWRMGAVLLCGVALLACVVGAFIVDDDIKLEPWARRMFVGGIYVMYALGVCMSIRALTLARSSSAGLISETKWISKWNVESEVPVRHFANRCRALVWHDLRRSRVPIRWFFLLGVIPGTLIMALFVNFSLPSYVITIILFAYIGFGAATNVIDKTNKGVVVMPTYLAAGPLSTAEIAWTRLLTICVMIMVSLLMSLVVFGAWTLWPGNQETWNAWAGEMAENTGSSSAGFQIATATFLATFVVLVGRAATFVWPALCGRAWLHFAAAVSIAFAYMIPVGVGIVWFLQQKSWDGAKESALYWCGYLPAIVVMALVAKAICAAITMIQLRTRRLATGRGIGLVVGGWLALTCILSVVFHLLIPHPLATLPWCFAAVALSIPLVRVLVLPISLQFGRHL